MKKKNYLFVTWKNDAGQLAWQVKKEGHNVKVCTEYVSCKDCFSGMIDLVDDWKRFTNWADVIIFDETGFGEYADQLRSRGHRVIGGSKYTDKLELRREFGQKEMQIAGIKVAPSQVFKKFEEAVQFIKRHQKRYVFKPIGFVQDNKDMVIVGNEEDGSDMVDILQSRRVAWRHRIKTFLLQEFIDGVEIAIGVFFNGNEFLYPVCVNFEFKRVFSDNLGPLTGDMGSLMFWSQPNQLFEATLKKMESRLRKSGYVGYFDINCIVNNSGIFPLEFTSRFGYPTIDTQICGLKANMGEFLFQLASGKSFHINAREGFQVGICAFLPTFFLGKKSVPMFRDLPISIPDPKLNKNLHYKDIKYKSGKYRIAGESKLLVTAVGQGDTVESASKKAYKDLSKVKALNLFYRNDIGDIWPANKKKLEKWGYLKTVKAENL